MLKNKKEKLMQEAASKGKYKNLYFHLSDMGTIEWETTFSELEIILGFELPKSAYIYRPWWANPTTSGHSHSLSWMMAKWQTSNVDLANETLTFQRCDTN